MTAILDKLILLAGGFVLALYINPHVSPFHVLGFLAALAFSCMESYCNPGLLAFRELEPMLRVLWLGLLALFLLAALSHPLAGAFLPLALYAMLQTLPWYTLLLPPAVLYLSFEASPRLCLFFCLLLFLTAAYLKYKTLRLVRLEQSFKLLRDTSTEYHLLLQKKNQDLMEKQDYEIHVATLKERNRIAREIHDNVGHILSRSLLQAGALMAVNRQDSLAAPLNALKDTLSGAMDAIRKSVHDLHDDSVDLQAAVHGLLKDFSGYQVTFDYDMGQVPRNVKYCFISILKEALSNISRHSKGDSIRIVLRQHPGFCQLQISDNGRDAFVADTGIGLENMKERVAALHGNFTFHTQDGFHVFASIPLEKGRTQRL